ncbi:MAG: transporter [Clostridia bacterium]|nr:transporter [Clostridia bacterium]
MLSTAVQFRVQIMKFSGFNIKITYFINKIERNYSTMDKKNNKIGIRVAIGCFVIMFIHLGTIGTAGLFIPQFVRTLNFPVSQISLNVTFSSLTGFFCSLLVGKLENRISAKNMLLIGSIAGILHYLVAAVTHNIMFLYLGSVMGGITFGFGTQACNAAVISQWFTEKRSTVIGIVFGGAAFGCAVMMFISGILIDSIGWRSTYMVFAALHLLVAIPINLFILKEKKEAKEEPASDKLMNAVETTNIEASGETLTIKDVHQSPSYWILMISMVLCGTLVTGFKTFVPSFWQANGMSALTSSQYISFFMVIATIASMASGTIADKFGNRVYIVYLHSAFLIGMVCVLLFSTQLDMVHIMIPILLVAIAYPLYGAIPATVATEAFGGKNYKKVCGELMGAFYVGLAMVSPIIGGLRDVTGTYNTGFTMITILSIISCLMIVFAIKISPAKRAAEEANSEGNQEAA